MGCLPRPNGTLATGLLSLLCIISVLLFEVDLVSHFLSIYLHKYVTLCMAPDRPGPQRVDSPIVDISAWFGQ